MYTKDKARDWERWNNPELVASIDKYWQGDVFRAHRERVRDVLASLFNCDPDCRTVLEFGCGTGNYVSIIHQLGREYAGVDITEAMVETARKKFPDTAFEVDDIFQSQQPNDSYDVVLSADVLVHLPEFEQPFATLYRIARRHVVLKLCYLTRRRGLARYLFSEPQSFMRRNSLGFIEHFFNLNEVRRTIESHHHPASIEVITFSSNQEISAYQAIVVVSKTKCLAANCPCTDTGILAEETTSNAQKTTRSPMNSLSRLRFKIVSSFAIAALGAIMFSRLLGVVPFSIPTLMPFVIASIFIIAGLWRGFIYLRAVRDVVKPS